METDSRQLGHPFRYAIAQLLALRYLIVETSKRFGMTPYVLDEIPLWGDLPFEAQNRLLEIPSLRHSLVSREYGAVIYGQNGPNPWTVSTSAYQGREPFDFWMTSSVALIARALALIQLAIIHTRKVSTPNWDGKSVSLRSSRGAEAHLFVYCQEINVSLNLHLAKSTSRGQILRDGIEILMELPVQ